MEDKREAVHLTDGASRDHERYVDQSEGMSNEKLRKRAEKVGRPWKGSDRVKDCLENIEEKTKRMKIREKKISESEKELRLFEKSLRRIGEIEFHEKTRHGTLKCQPPPEQFRTCRFGFCIEEIKKSTTSIINRSANH